MTTVGEAQREWIRLTRGHPFLDLLNRRRDATRQSRRPRRAANPELWHFDGGIRVWWLADETIRVGNNGSLAARPLVKVQMALQVDADSLDIRDAQWSALDAVVAAIQPALGELQRDDLLDHLTGTTELHGLDRWHTVQSDDVVWQLCAEPDEQNPETTWVELVGHHATGQVMCFDPSCVEPLPDDDEGESETA